MADQEYPPSLARLREAQETYQELNEMDQQLKIWEMILEYLASGDFLLVIVTIFFGIAIIKSIKIIDRYVNETTKTRSDDNSTED